MSKYVYLYSGQGARGQFMIDGQKVKIDKVDGFKVDYAIPELQRAVDKGLLVIKESKRKRTVKKAPTQPNVDKEKIVKVVKKSKKKTSSKKKSKKKKSKKKSTRKKKSE